MKLIKLGTGKHAAIRAELSRKGIFPKQVSVLAERRKPSGVGKPDGLRHAATFKIGNLFWDDSKGYWRLSRTLSTHTRDANAWLVEQGVISLKEVWVSLYYPEGKASKHRLPR